MGGSVVGVVSINILSIAMTVIVITKTINNLTIITLGPGSIPWFFVTELFAQSGIKWHQYHRDETKTNAIFRSMDLSPTMHSSFIITFDLTKVTINNHQLLTHLLGRHLSFIAPSNVPFLVKGGGPFCGPQLFSFCTWKLFAFQGSSGHQWQKNIQSPLLWPELCRVFVCQNIQCNIF